MSKRFIDADALMKELQEEIDFETPMYTEEQNKYFNGGLRCAIRDVKEQPTADVVEVVRCRDCKHFKPDFVLTSDGERRPYTEEEIRKGKIVTGDVGINCGSRCERFGYWDENKIPVWFSENDFCSYGERRAEE